jgi:hypothetical protein
MIAFENVAYLITPSVSLSFIVTADKGWSVSSVHVCVGDMNDEEGQKMESQLPG